MKKEIAQPQRNRIRKIIKAHQPDFKLGKNTDILVYHNYLLFMKRLLTEAKQAAISQKETTIHSNHINSVTDKVLQEFRG
ncbi:the chicken Cenp-T histone FoldCENP-W Complex, crystal form I [Neoconidiobolus thromboides FSU 785]|nr:the chicken Cenp-T histone FoldCENP-W Complex, crystal form I [Neoconidiobolus thromboides FSU 785]